MASQKKALTTPKKKDEVKPVASKEDLVLVVGKNADSPGYNVLRKRNDRVEAGLMKPLEEGKAIEGEVVRLEPRPETPLLFDAKVQYAPPKRIRQQGPGQVASPVYRKNWDRVFRRRPGPVAN